MGDQYFRGSSGYTYVFPINSGNNGANAYLPWGADQSDNGGYNVNTYYNYESCAEIRMLDMTSVSTVLVGGMNDRWCGFNKNFVMCVVDGGEWRLS